MVLGNVGMDKPDSRRDHLWLQKREDTMHWQQVFSNFGMGFNRRPFNGELSSNEDGMGFKFAHVAVRTMDKPDSQ